MEETIKLEMTKDEAAALIEQCLKEIREANARMDKSEAERMQLRAETREILRQLGAALNVTF